MGFKGTLFPEKPTWKRRLSMVETWFIGALL
jgi:hypothetical protein